MTDLSCEKCQALFTRGHPSQKYCSLECRFLAKVNSSVGFGPTGSCWVWTAGVDQYGYGRFCVNGINRRAHQISHEIFIGPVPIGKLVRHSCDNPGCCNPRHLLSGTSQDNTDDKVRAGRQHHPGGEINGRAKLSKREVVEIRRLYSRGGITQKELGEEFGVTQVQISSIVRNEVWRNVS